MTEHKDIYASHGDLYERLVEREDYQHNILAAIQEIIPVKGKDVVETGAGTGRLTRILAPHVRSIQAFDASQHMLNYAIAALERSGLRNWSTGVSDHRALPAADGSADIAISGWSICYLVDWNREGWSAEVERALAEMRRVLRPGGVTILLETQGTGYETPHPPEHLVEYYSMLERLGFTFRWIRTDYAFESAQEARELSAFFFRETFEGVMSGGERPILPECTGIWWKRV